MARGIAKYRWFAKWVKWILGVLGVVLLSCAAPVLAVAMVFICAAMVTAALIIHAFGAGKCRAGRSQRGETEFVMLVLATAFGSIVFSIAGCQRAELQSAVPGVAHSSVVYPPKPTPTPTPAVARIADRVSAPLTTTTIRINADGASCSGPSCPLPTPARKSKAWYNGFQ